VEWAGVYPLQTDWALGRAAEGRLVLNAWNQALVRGKPAPVK
jgi:hypothetical protein